MRRLLREQEQGGALPPALTISRDANTGAGWGFTDPAAAIQLRLRVAIGLQALQRCSGFLNRRARGSTVATHHFLSAEGRVWSAEWRGRGILPGCLLIPHSEFHILEAGVAQQRQQQFRKLPGNPPHESASLSVGPIFRKGVMEYWSAGLLKASGHCSEAHQSTSPVIHHPNSAMLP